MPCMLRLSSALIIALVAATSLPVLAQQRPTDVKIVYPAPSSTSWPIWLATDGGYFAKYGLNMKIEMAMHPAGPAAVVAGEALTHNLGLDSSMLAAMKGEQLVLVSSPLQVGQFVLVGTKDITDAKSLAGKRVAVGRVGDPPYHYAQGLLQFLKVDTKSINWVSAGAPPQRALALRNGLADAAMLTPPDYYKLIDDGFKAVAHLADHREVPVATSYMFRRKTMVEQPQLIEAVLKAHAEAVKRFYDDKTFAMATIKKYAGIKDDAILSRLYDETAKNKVLERIPYVPARAVKGIIERDKAQVPELTTYDFRKVIRQDFIDRLADQGFYQQVFGPGIAAELADRRAAAFR